MKWINRLNFVSICFFNLLLVAILGLIMRYKIGFEFPVFDQRNLQHAHSHFAFAGWVSLLLMALMVKTITKVETKIKSKLFNFLLGAYLFCSYGVLISFFVQGYGFLSILFLVLTIVISFVFGIEYFRVTRKMDYFESNKWFLGGLFFNVISTIGTFYLSYMMATKTVDQDSYLSSVFWYLHFQYNGWFFFVCMGLLVDYLAQLKFNLSALKSIYWLFLLSCIPAFGLSMLWAKVPLYLFVFIVFASIAQVVAWVMFIYYLVKSKFLSLFNVSVKVLFLCLFISFSAKFLLQLGSTVPYVSHLAFGFRPIIIAYLHLVLLACISMFLIVYVYVNKLVYTNRFFKVGLFLFAIGIYVNEILLGLQGVASLSYTLVPNINTLLFLISGVIVLGLVFMNSVILKKDQ
jgi:hypothetical protein